MRRLWWMFLGLCFRLLYNEFAWAYDVVAWVVSWGRWTAWGRTTVPLPNGSEAVLTEAGFALHIVWERVGHSRVMLVIGKRTYAGW